MKDDGGVGVDDEPMSTPPQLTVQYRKKHSVAAVRYTEDRQTLHDWLALFDPNMITADGAGLGTVRIRSGKGRIECWTSVLPGEWVVREDDGFLVLTDREFRGTYEEEK